MSKMGQYKSLFDKHVVVHCIDGSLITGYWSECFDADDHDWDNESLKDDSILIDTDDGVPIEIFDKDIERIEAVGTSAVS